MRPFIDPPQKLSVANKTDVLSSKGLKEVVAIIHPLFQAGIAVA
jgi:hypothetical protein